MKIAISERLRPHSHLPGVSCIIPGSWFAIKLFPSLIKVISLKEHESKEVAEVSLNIAGPMKDFTVILDLEKGVVKVFGKTVRGFLRYQISSLKSGGLLFTVDKAPQDFSYSSSSPLIKFSSDELCFEEVKERLSFGSHKLLDWDLVKRRNDLKEILPVWHRLGKWIPESKAEDLEDSLLAKVRKTILNQEKMQIFDALDALFKAGFEGLMTPRSFDDFYQGYSLPPISKGSPLIILSEVSRLLCSIFIKSSEDEVSILPSLPQEIVFGKFCNACIPKAATVDLEWSKRKPRRMVLKAETKKTLRLNFPKGIRHARLRLNDKEKGCTFKSGSLLDIVEGSHYFFDHFEQ